MAAMTLTEEHVVGTIIVLVIVFLFCSALADKSSEPQSVCVEIRSGDGQMWNLDVPPGSSMVTISSPERKISSLNILSYQGRCLKDQEEGESGSSKD